MYIYLNKREQKSKFFNGGGTVVVWREGKVKLPVHYYV